MENKVKLEKVGYLIADNEIIPFITNTRETHIKSLATEEVAPINLINGDKTCAGDHQNNFVKKLLDSQSIRVVENYVNLMYDFDSEMDSLLSFVSFKDCVVDNIARDILLMGKCENSNKRLNKKHKLDDKKYSYKQFVQFSKTLENALNTCTIKQQKQSASIHKAIQKSLDRKEKNQFDF